MISSKDVNIFYERLGLSTRLHGACTTSHTLLRKQMLQDLYKWAIATHEVNRVGLIYIRVSKA